MIMEENNDEYEIVEINEEMRKYEQIHPRCKFQLIGYRMIDGHRCVIRKENLVHQTRLQVMECYPHIRIAERRGVRPNRTRDVRVISEFLGNLHPARDSEIIEKLQKFLDLKREQERIMLLDQINKQAE